MAEQPHVRSLGPWGFSRSAIPADFNTKENKRSYVSHCCFGFLLEQLRMCTNNQGFVSYMDYGKNY